MASPSKRQASAASPSSSVVAREDDSRAKRALLESALRMFVRGGLSETSVRAVAEDAGVSNPAIFKFFSGRDELAQCVFDRCYERLAEALEAPAAVRGYEARARAIALAATRFMDQELDAFLFVTEELRRFWPQVPPALRRRSILRVVEGLFALGEEEGRVSPDHHRGLLVATTIGLFAQLGRGIYFGEIKGTAGDLAPEIERLILRVGW
jgi:AcrR family transcriptional regulator